MIRRLKMRKEKNTAIYNILSNAFWTRWNMVWAICEA